VRTIVGNQPATKQWRSADGQRLVSIVRSDELFRFVEENELTEPASRGLEAYSYWSETYRSGLYPSEEAAERDAHVSVSWLGGTQKS
jgi:hypothetical protein